MSSLNDLAEIDRRSALKMLAAAASTLMTGCSRPEEEIIPYVNMPEGLVAGEPMRFATTFKLSGYGRGFFATSIDGHPTKIEGNPRHPFSLGATDVFAEAEVMSLYDPNRSRSLKLSGRSAKWSDFSSAWQGAIHGERGGDIALVTGRVTSPTTLARLAALRRRLPEMRLYRYEPVNDDAARAGARQAFGRIVQTLPQWDNVDVILLLGADPLGSGPDQLRAGRGFAARRKTLARRQRIFSAESIWTLSGAAADVRCPLQPGAVREVARVVANSLGANLGQPMLPENAAEFARVVTAELQAANGTAFVLVGEDQPSEVHALAHWINERLKAPIKFFTPQDTVEIDHAMSLQALADDLHNHSIKTLVIADANPVYDAPDAMNMAEAVANAPFSIHLGSVFDETAARCRWHAPLSHALESWGDARALDGTASLVQPLIRPLYDTRTMDEFFGALADEPVTRAYELTRTTWKGVADGEFESWWRRSLHNGVIASSAAQAITPPPAALPALPPLGEGATATIVIAPDPTIWDGRFANNAWLQECPKPFTRQVWGNAAQLSPADAHHLRLTDQDTLDITTADITISLPVVVSEGQADGVIAITLGHGRWASGKIGNGIGARVSALGSKPLARTVVGVTLRKGGQAVTFRSPQMHNRLTGRTEDLFQIATLASLLNMEMPETSSPPSLLPTPQRGDYAWGMVVNTDACIGCNACVVACQAENNVPIVGPEEISKGRDMHWLRVDGYGFNTNKEMRQGFQPVPCMHCELAPCEPVCPVEASVHDHEGLNVQVYNRCIGTRFCQANCPYKVRRFNWFAYAGAQAYGEQTAALKAQHNPDVSSRGRGVMEKCNYCLQRISRARRTAEREGREVVEGEVVTACQAACPTRAIQFGDVNRPDSLVSELKRTAQHYILLEELNTRPRTTYLKRIYNDGAVK